MFHSRGSRGRESSSSSTRSSFHTANDSSLKSDDEIQTILGSSSSEIPSLVLGQRSYSSGGAASHTVEDYESHYSTAKSSFDSRYRSDTFYTATSLSGRRDYSSPLYSSEFEPDDSASITESIVENEFENDKDAERHFLRAKLKSLQRGKQKIKVVEPDSDGEIEAEKKKFVGKQLAVLQHRKKGALPKHPKRRRDKKKDERSKERSGSEDPPLLIPRGVVDKLRIQNILYHMKQVSQTPVHEIDQCESCRKVKESLVEREFMKTKHRYVYNQLTEERYKQHIVTHDPLSEIGNLASALPKVSSDPDKIWNHLLQNAVT